MILVGLVVVEHCSYRPWSQRDVVEDPEHPILIKIYLLIFGLQNHFFELILKGQDQFLKDYIINQTKSRINRKIKKSFFWLKKTTLQLWWNSLVFFNSCIDSQSINPFSKGWCIFPKHTARLFQNLAQPWMYPFPKEFIPRPCDTVGQSLPLSTTSVEALYTWGKASRAIWYIWLPYWYYGVTLLMCPT